MAVNRFVLNGISYHGKGAIGEIPAIIAAKGFKKAFIATDPDLIKFGVTKKSPIFLTEKTWHMRSIRTLSPTPQLKTFKAESPHTRQAEPNI